MGSSLFVKAQLRKDFLISMHLFSALTTSSISEKTIKLASESHKTNNFVYLPSWHGYVKWLRF